MRMRVPAALFGLMCVFAAAAAAQTPPAATRTTPGALAGSITSGPGTALPGVTVQVFLPGEKTAVATATSGPDGRYSVKALKQGVYRIEFALPGFEPVSRYGIVVFDNAVAELNVEMRRGGAASSADARPPGGGGALAPGEVAVRLETPLGVIVIAVDTKRAPVTAANFLKYVDGGFYNGGRFHRATRPDNYKPSPPNRPMMEIIQGGPNPERKGQGFPPIPLERTSVTGLRHVRGVVSMARGAPDTATSDFFILLDDQPSLDFGGKRFDDEQGAAAFGRVISGLEVVRAIQQQPVKEQSLAPPVPILSAKRGQ
jgi:peptidyl-prolyl cis-trans isomerase A (cyclophilin A)